MNIRHDEKQASGTGHDGRSDDGEIGLRSLLAGYDRQVEEAFDLVRASASGTDRVRLLHNTLRPAITVHDVVVGSVLCPLLEDIPAGPSVAHRLRRGCRERADLLSRFDALSKGVAARNVYPVSGQEVEGILEGLQASFDGHADVETRQVTGVLEAAGPGAEADVTGVVAARMAIEARHSPLHSHPAMTAHPGSRTRKALYRFGDGVVDWVDAHHGWSGPEIERPSPKATEVADLERQAARTDLTVHELLASHDELIEGLVGELAVAATDAERAESARRLHAAVTVHDLVLCGVVGPLLDGVPGGRPVATRLRQGCARRAELQRRWQALTRQVPPAEAYRTRAEEVAGIMEPLLESFEVHRREDTPAVADLLESLPPDRYRTWRSPFADVMWPWHSEGPNLLALQMALSAESAPTRPHHLLMRHPRARSLRSVFRAVDHFGDRWRDNALERWLSPKRPRAPFTGTGH